MQSENISNFSGFYLGEVVQHCDNGKIKVFIPGVYPEEWKEDWKNLPDCLQMSPLFGGSNKGNGVFSYPNYGAIVVCYFQNNDQNFPIAIGSILGGNTTNYNACKPSDNVDDKTNGTDAYIHAINVDQTQIKLYESGLIEIYTYDKKQPVNERKISSIKISGAGNIDISSSTKITVQSDNIQLSASNQIELDANKIKLNAPAGFINVVSDRYLNQAASNLIDKSKLFVVDASSGSYVLKSETQDAIFRY